MRRHSRLARRSARGLAGLVNNAGAAYVGPVEMIPLEQIRRQFEVNVFGHLAVSQALIPLLRIARGRLINISSLNGILAVPFFGPYSASKACAGGVFRLHAG